MKRAVVILGNGPSLKGLDLHDFGDIPTIGMNAAYRHWDKIGWYPKIYCCLDDVVVMSHQDEIKRLIHEKKCGIFFLHQNILKAYPGLAAWPNVFILSSFMDNKLHVDARVKCRVPALDPFYFWSCLPNKITTGVFAVRFAAFLGYKEMLLLGIDAKYQEIVEGAIRKEGSILEMESTPSKCVNYFFDDYQQRGDRYNLPTPPAHEGNLHHQVFEALASDYADYAPEINIYCGSKKSELYSKKTFPFLDPAKFIIQNKNAGELPFPNKKAAQPSWVPVAHGHQFFYCRTMLLGKVVQTGLMTWTWEKESIGYSSGASLSFIYTGLHGIVPGSRVTAKCTIKPSVPCEVLIRLNRQGDSDFAGQENKIKVRSEEVSLRITAEFFDPHDAVRLEIRVAADIGDSKHLDVVLKDVNLSLEYM